MTFPFLQGTQGRILKSVQLKYLNYQCTIILKINLHKKRKKKKEETSRRREKSGRVVGPAWPGTRLNINFVWVLVLFLFKKSFS
tara:strand:+ start:774 stop:1025 length:252 start_codon:yes stop_codon:yes gene_type:complete